MSWLNRMEQKYGRYAIPGITKFFVCAALAGYIISMLESRMSFSLTGLLCFNMNQILRGQIWRLVTWVFCQSGRASLLNLIFLLCLLSMGTSLESIIGSFRLNVYMLGGVLITLVGGILVYFIGYPSFSAYNASAGMLGIGVPYLSTYYILLSIFMALALCMPDGTVMLYFIIPIRMKWILILYFAELFYELYTYFRVGGFFMLFALGSQIIFALLNLGLFFWMTRSQMGGARRNHAGSYRNSYQRQYQNPNRFRNWDQPSDPFKKRYSDQFSQPRPGSGISRHKCAICGRTELDDPTLTFRYCSKCAGNYEYCNEHLFTHEHIRPM